MAPRVSAAALIGLRDRDRARDVRRLEVLAWVSVAGSVALSEGRAYFGHYGNSFVCVDLETADILANRPESLARRGGDRRPRVEAGEAEERRVVGQETDLAVPQGEIVILNDRLAINLAADVRAVDFDSQLVERAGH